MSTVLKKNSITGENFISKKPFLTEQGLLFCVSNPRLPPGEVSWKEWCTLLSLNKFSHWGKVLVRSICLALTMGSFCGHFEQTIHRKIFVYFSYKSYYIFLVIIKSSLWQGPAKVELNDPKNFMKKHEKEPKLPDSKYWSILILIESRNEVRQSYTSPLTSKEGLKWLEGSLCQGITVDWSFFT